MNIIERVLGKRLEKIPKEFVGESEAAKTIREKIKEAAASNANILIEGESGVGKGLAGEIIHNHSGRAGKFIVVNCASIQPALFESELFGHRKGAFTDAKEDKRGLIEEAEGGTLLLDEITEIPLDIQAKLLRFTDTGRYRRLGEEKENKANVRIITATNRDITKAMEEKKLRHDLYYRLAQLKIKIPPLRERAQDIEALIKHYSPLLNERKLSREAKQYLINYPFPGNVRELMNLLEVLGMGEGEVSLEELKETLKQYEIFPGKQDEIVEKIWERIKAGGNFWEMVKKPFLARELNRSQVKEFLKRGLALSGGKWKALCKLVNLSEEEYHKFMALLHKYKLKP